MENRTKTKRRFLTALTTAIKKNSIRKHANELKVREKTVRTATKQDLSSDLNPLDYALSYLPNPSAQAGYDTRSIFKRSLTGLNSEFSFS